MINVWDIKTIFMAFWSAFSYKKEWGHLLKEYIIQLYISLDYYTQELLQLLPKFGFSVVFWWVFWLVCERVKELNYMCHTHKKTCLARPVVCLNRTLTTFENAMFLSYLRMARWFSPKSSIFSTPTGWYRLRMSKMVLRYLYEKKFL